MNAITAPIAPPFGTDRSSPAGAFVSYARDDDGHRLAEAVVSGLRARGCDVSWDHDLPLQNPSSLPAWMEEQITSRVVVFALSLGSVTAFEDAVARGMAPRQGVRYEIRAIRQLIYDHKGRYDCPVIPVMPHSFELDLVPATLRSLDICRIDAATGGGMDQLAARIRRLEGAERGAAVTAEQIPPSDDRRDIRQLVHELTTDLSGEQALELVRACLESASPWELVHAFPHLEETIKDHGQVELLRELTDTCLRVVRSTKQLLRSELALKSRLLICGEAWCRQQDHQLPEAVAAVEEGVLVADQAEDPRAAALGMRALGSIHRLIAEEARGPDRDQHLSDSTASLCKARALFEAIDTGRVRRHSEVGACDSLSARTQLSRYRLLNDEAALEHAEELARSADELMPVNQWSDRYDLTILQAEIAAENRRRSREGLRLLSNVIESLIAEPADRYSEILARAYQARANPALASRDKRSDVVADLKKARDIFDQQKLSHAAASCSWTILKTDPKSITHIKITKEDWRQLEELTADPRVRLAAIARRQDDAGSHHGHRKGRKVDWTPYVDQVRLPELTATPPAETLGTQAGGS